MQTRNEAKQHLEISLNKTDDCLSIPEKRLCDSPWRME